MLSYSESESLSVMSDSLQPHRLYSPWNSPGQNTGVGSCSFLQGIFPIQGSNPVLLHCRQPQFYSWVGKICWRRDRPPTPVFLGFPCGSASKESACNVGDLGSIPGLGRFPGEGHGSPLQHSFLENSIDRGVWWATVYGVTKGQTQLSD